MKQTINFMWPKGSLWVEARQELYLDISATRQMFTILMKISTSQLVFSIQGAW